MYYIYVLVSLTHRTRYIGSTDKIEKRLLEHNNGRVRYTKGRRPWKLIYKEKFSSRSEAMLREKELKSGQGRKFLDERISTYSLGSGVMVTRPPLERRDSRFES